MKKTLVSVLGLAMATSGLATPAAAQSDNAAQVYKDLSCFMFVPNEQGMPIGGVSSPDAAHVVATKNGGSKIVCQFDIPEGLAPSKAVKVEGFNCGTYFGLTNDSFAVATPGGKLTLVCKIHPNK